MTGINASRCDMRGGVDGTAGARKVVGFADPLRVFRATPPGRHHAPPRGADEIAGTEHARYPGRNSRATRMHTSNVHRNDWMDR